VFVLDDKNGLFGRIHSVSPRRLADEGILKIYITILFVESEK
jgi:hypothetical protein